MLESLALDDETARSPACRKDCRVTFPDLDAPVSAASQTRIKRQLVEQAAAYSGAADEERNADRISDQQAKLDALLKEREELLK